MKKTLRRILCLLLAMMLLEIPVFPAQAEDVYLIRDSADRLLSESELWQWDYESLGYIMNEIFARHGYCFEPGGKYDQYFRCQSWYRPNANPNNDVACYPYLSDLEWKNVNLIKTVRADMRSADTDNLAGRSYLDYYSSGNSRLRGFTAVSMERGQMLAVYSAPDRFSYRGYNGGAVVSTDGPVYAAGWENGWLLVMYDTIGSAVRVGYVYSGDIWGGVSMTTQLSFAYQDAETVRTVNLTDDPATSSNIMAILPYGTHVTYLTTFYGDTVWDYIEVTLYGQRMRGFIPCGALKMDVQSDDRDIVVPAYALSQPTALPTAVPTMAPTLIPTNTPKRITALTPTTAPTAIPTNTPMPTTPPTPVPTYTPMPTAAPTPTTAPTAMPGVSVPVDYLDQDGLLLNRTTIICYGDTVLHADDKMVSADYTLISDTDVQVTIRDGQASPAHVTFRYQQRTPVATPTAVPGAAEIILNDISYPIRLFAKNSVLFTAEEDQQLGVTVYLEKEITGPVSIFQDDVLLCEIENNGNGKLTAYLPMYSEDEYSFSLTAQADGITSNTITCSFESRVTEAMVDTMIVLGDDAIEYMDSIGKANDFSENALILLQDFLLNDPRTDSVEWIRTDRGLALIYLTKDGLASMYGDLTPSDDAAGFSDGSAEFDYFVNHNQQLRNSDLYFDSDFVMTNSNIASVVFDPDDDVMGRINQFCSLEMPLLAASIHGVYRTPYTGQAAVDILGDQELGNNGLIILAGHGAECTYYYNPFNRFVAINIGNNLPTNLQGLKVDTDSDGFFVKKFKIIYNTTAQAYLITSNYLNETMSDHVFDNSVILLLVCDGLSNDDIADAFLLRGASAVIGNRDFFKTQYIMIILNELSNSISIDDPSAPFISIQNMLGNMDHNRTVTGFVDELIAQLSSNTIDDLLAYTKTHNEGLKYGDIGYITRNDFDQIVHQNPQILYNYVLSSTDSSFNTPERQAVCVRDDSFLLSGSGVITGSVYCYHNDTIPYPGARVIVYRWLDHQFWRVEEVRSDVRGYYSTSSLPAGLYYISAEPLDQEAGYEEYATCCVELTERMVTAENLFIGCLRGYVFDKTTKGPVKDAEVVISFQDGSSVTIVTDIYGAWRFDLQQRGNLNFCIHADGYFDQLFVLTEDDMRAHPLELIETYLDANLYLDGRVVTQLDMKQNEPYAGVGVTLSSLDGEKIDQPYQETDSNGDYRFAVRPGRYKITVEKDGLMSDFMVTVDWEHATLDKDNDPVFTAEDVVLGWTLSGYVIDAVTKQAIPGVKVDASTKLYYTQRTDEKGFWYANVSDSPILTSIQFSKKGYKDGEAWASAAADESYSFTVEMTPLFDLSGYVQNEESHEALPGVTVTCVNDEGSYTTQTDGNGCFVFEALEPGYYDLSFTKTGFEDAHIGVPHTDKAHTVLLDPVLMKPERIDYIFFGRYEQDGDLSNGPEPIEWIVVEKSETKALLLSRYILDYIPYTEKDVIYNNAPQYDSDNWYGSYIRYWLNNDFYENSFSYAEKRQIVDSKVRDYPAEDDTMASYVIDKVFVLSRDFGELYDSWYGSPCFSSNWEFSATTSTPYALTRTNRADDGVWYLRDNGGVRYTKSAIGKDGTIIWRITSLDDGKAGVRPAMCVSISVLDTNN